MTSPSEIARALDTAASQAESFVDIASRLEKSAAEPSPEHELAPFVLAFYYMLIEARSPRREVYGPYAPMIETDTHSFPPLIANLSASVKDAWAEVVGQSRSAAVRARLNDLLWVVRHGDEPYTYAKEAIDACLALAEEWRDLSKVEALVRALELARLINDREAALAVAGRIAEAAHAALDETDRKPGVSLRLIEALIDIPDPPAEVDVLLQRAAVRYADAHIGDSIADLRAGRARDAARVREIRAEQLERWREEAEKSDGLAAVAHLQHGLELARTFGLADEASAFRRALQEFDRDSIEFQRIEARAEVDSDAIEELLDSLVEDDWPGSLRSFGETGPPTGDVERNERFVRELMAEAPLSFLFTKTVLGPENTIIRNIAGDTAHFAAELSRHERQSIEFWSRLAAEALHRMIDRHGTPDDESLVEYFAQGVVAPEYADAFARGVVAYAEARYDESAMIVVARLESVIREIARSAGLVVIREPIGEKPGGVRSLGEVLLSLRGVIDESWRRYLWNTLAEPLGVNLRNRLAHGLASGDPLNAALLLHIASFLALLRPQE